MKTAAGRVRLPQAPEEMIADAAQKACDLARRSSKTRQRLQVYPKILRALNRKPTRGSFGKTNPTCGGGPQGSLTSAPIALFFNGLTVRRATLKEMTANTVTPTENGADAKQSTTDRLRQALESGGIEFIDEKRGRSRVRLRKRQPKRE
jgi:hypothetical protein